MKKKMKIDDYPSLYDVFEIGDRVIRFLKNKNGKNHEYKGVICAIDDKYIEIYWDTLDGHYTPKDIDISFTHCDLEEVFYGKEKYGPIKIDTNFKKFI